MSIQFVSRTAPAAFILSAVLSSALLMATPALAQYAGPSGVAASTVSSLLKSGTDDQPVILRGRITKRLTDDKYEFTDRTGSIRVDIDSDRFPPEVIDDKTLVEIHGEFEKDFMQSPEIEVKLLRRVSGS
ncbi:NirD/YgiW/YdeI family stress tolerance protein [Variovorax dokdonensis]|uniref:NirD/YgiW/YdeI family stress tolerance protein n=1 Tax=Variovorax dokdonensis TaxID=344883 RepID=A0ABT7NG90_9BURK|nr:NirD/YgiW/YdeI family stress tolerance protein [Variovorax dokdonensis]MDM0046969.1 NirD/YgiW/YdeI family stress tolerance protein [Variovorax dokdonensis]